MVVVPPQRPKGNLPMEDFHNRVLWLQIYYIGFPIECQGVLYRIFDIWRIRQMFKDIFVNYIQERGITAYKVAKGTGISQGQMNEYKNGKTKPTIENLIKIADYLECSIDFLLGRLGTDEREIKIINGFRSVNEDGKEAILQQVEYISNDKRYKKFEDVPKEA